MTIGTPRVYEVCGALSFGGLRHRSFARLAALSGAEAGDRVLDVGCGTGHLTRHMAEWVGPGGAVTGVDPSLPVLDYARRKSHRRPQWSTAAYREGMAEALDLPDASFDTVVTSLMLHHLPEELRPVALREMVRVLRPGGPVLVADFRPPKSGLVRHLVHATGGHAMADYRADHGPARRGLRQSLHVRRAAYRISLPAVAIWVALAVLVAVLATEAAATRASRLTVREALA
ncbi:class I SAM-dependent methyltransferase [Streptomyces sp. IBSNAI002]|uniref:class I SAM-dependent methyltransferase n=1 Tax=Streptomyces sp. IBSNAI002 TaxID=3457500 RepID=UPI003FD1FBAB